MAPKLLPSLVGVIMGWAVVLSSSETSCFSVNHKLLCPIPGHWVSGITGLGLGLGMFISCKFPGLLILRAQLAAAWANWNLKFKEEILGFHQRALWLHFTGWLAAPVPAKPGSGFAWELIKQDSCSAQAFSFFSILFMGVSHRDLQVKSAPFSKISLKAFSVLLLYLKVEAVRWWAQHGCFCFLLCREHYRIERQIYSFNSLFLNVFSMTPIPFNKGNRIWDPRSLGTLSYTFAGIFFNASTCTLGAGKERMWHLSPYIITNYYRVISLLCFLPRSPCFRLGELEQKGLAVCCMPGPL